MVRCLLRDGGGAASGNDAEDGFGRGDMREERDHGGGGGDERDEEDDLAAVQDSGLTMRVRWRATRVAFSDLWLPRQCRGE